ncbi:MAG: hypothetical protein K2G60_01895 [Oscillospiraceae bacterium]|nr:hypothetical protein [Oscillospiraceae bacterium]
MTDIENLLASVSPEDMERLKSVASSLMGDATNKNEELATAPAFSMESLKPIMSAIGKMNDNDDRIKLIMHLKPLLGPDRQRRADEAVKFLHIMQILPELRGLL